MTQKTKERLHVYRGEAVSVSRMCAALPILFDQINNNDIVVCPFPIFSAKNGEGTDILIASIGDDMTIFDMSEIPDIDDVDDINIQLH